MVREEWREAGCICEPVAGGVDLKAEIRRMCGEKKAVVMAHLECRADVLALADVKGSTAVMLKYAEEHPDREYIVATEAGILHEMRRKCPRTVFMPVPPEHEAGGCNECEHMKLNTLLKLYNTLKYEWPEVDVPEDIAREAVKPIERMLELS